MNKRFPIASAESSRKNSKTKARRIGARVALLGVLVALTITLSYVEHAVGGLMGGILPGVKLGLANLSVLFALYRLSIGEAGLVVCVKAMLAAWLSGAWLSGVYSLCGGLLSLSVMWLARRCPYISVVGVSVLGGVCHNVGQICCATWLMHTSALFWYLPVLLLVGCVSGCIIGWLGGWVLLRVPRSAVCSEKKPQKR